ncbi:MAG TPA: ParA family protein [Nitrospiraceae bacterium]|nr:ParA family protein [Nitrospiraceae bacterium]
MTRLIAVANQKGGVGKTTTSINLATYLAINGAPTLLVDMDPQSNATSGLGISPRDLTKSVYDCLMRSARASEVIVPTGVSQLSVLPANRDLAGAEIELIHVLSRELVLRRALDHILNDYRYVIIDCPPAFGLLTINALAAATSVVVPVQCEYYAMEGLGWLMSNVERVRQSLNQQLDLEGVLLTMFDIRNTLARQVAEEVRAHFKEKVFKTVIPRNVTLAEAPSYGRPALLYNAGSAGAQAYLEFAKELMSHGEESPR